MKLTKLFGKNNSKIVNILMILGVIALIAFLFKYNNQKNGLSDGMKNLSPMNLEEPAKQSGQEQIKTVVGVSAPETNDYLTVSGLETTEKSVKSCNNQPVMNPQELLPSASNSEWSNIAPSKGLENISFVSAGQHIGTNTVGSSLRNPNLQVRSEPVIPKTNTGPWNTSTIEPDNTRKALEIGGLME